MKYENEIENKELDFYKSELSKTSSTRFQKAIEKFFMAALGVIPWVGGFIAAVASFKTEEADLKRESLQNQWLEEHSLKMIKLRQTLMEISKRFENIGEQINERIESEEYLDIVRKAFRIWDQADTEEKRGYISKLIANSAGSRLCSDDVVRLFIDWLNSYHESHFAIITEIYNTPGVTRYEIWHSIYNIEVRDDSAEADLYKRLIRDLSTGGVIRQVRDITNEGQFLKKIHYKKTVKTATIETAFENTKSYVLTELGQQFVHYSMTELVPRIDEN